ncbi:hypothetical protein Pla22_16140 [Rubripirellula amarantea]|uniref:PEP-CTERM protein-sorting domain-containing protein n=1 Tax=Rubripirellula amarantea TaxID=2527999 RepID=A0A5C5WTX9_9BACT|nr:PEP-CTERM sorting domain-containing protein [Rubripirellula amarantea]TWT53980.1 hypothetical protein Pla22_16140 [Rubripirellula amarantea]
MPISRSAHFFSDFAQSRTIAILAGLTFALCNPWSANAELLAVSGGYDTNGNLLESFLYSVDESTGSANLVGSGTGVTHLSGLAIHPTTGVLYAIENVPTSGLGKLHTIDRATGTASPIGNTNTLISDIGFHSNGTLYGWLEFGSSVAFTDDTDVLVTIDTASAQIAFVGSHQVASNQTGLAFANDDTLYLKSGEVERGGKPQSEWIGSLRTLNPLDGSVEPTSASRLDTSPYSISTLTIDDAGRGYTIVNYNEGSALESINIETGEISHIGLITDANHLDESGSPNPLNIRALVAVQAVPEPSSVLAIAITSAAWIIFRRRKRLETTTAD